MPTQYQMYYDAARKLGERDAAFMELLQHPTNPLTPEDVDRLIARNPARYSRYAGFGTKGKDQAPS